MPNPGRPVRCVETGDIYPSAAAAGRAVYVVKETVHQAIRRGYRAGGYRWVWADTEDRP